MNEERARLFAALDLPEELVAGIGAWQALALNDETWRAVRPEALHLTLVFLGSRPAAEITAIEAVVRDAAALPAPEIALGEQPVGIPRRQPRAVAFEVDGPQVTRLEDLIVRGLVRIGAFAGDDRPFWPHVTVARRRGRGPLPSRPLPEPLLRGFSLDRLVLYRSETHPEGARHDPEVVVPLRRRGGGDGV